jgi:isoleucyl-tRNA synthetase
MDAYDLPGAAGHLQGFIDALNNWYIRRSRDRFWAPAGDQTSADKTDAYDTLFTVLTTFAQAAAPFLPLIMEEIYQGLNPGDSTSVHLSDWPDAESLPDDPALVAAMDLARDVCSTALGLREAEGLRVRLPLAKLTVAGAGAEALGPFRELVAEEVNVKVVELTESAEAHASFVLKPDGKVLGPRLGGDVQKVFAAARDGDWTRSDDGSVKLAGHTLGEDEYELAIEASDDTTAASLSNHEGLVLLDTELSQDLIAEGLARDVVRHVQQARKDADLVVTDRIALTLELSEPVAAAVRAHERYVADQVLATSIAYQTVQHGVPGAEVTIDGDQCRIGIVLSS